MLLRLTLALLWSPACWAAQIYGTGGGQYFSTSRNPEYEITGVRVTRGALGILRSIQVKYGPSWDTVYGNKLPGDTQEFILSPGEHIIQIWGSYKTFLRSLALYTDKGRFATFGKDDGASTFIVYPNKEGEVLKVICGQYKLLGLTGLCFEWDEPINAWDEVQESTTP
ncbi:pancreatic adenocarcinoma up-regulated factor [Crocuta crocuta]